jgi:hypothetical protein
MKLVIKIEEAAMFIVAAFLFHHIGNSWLLFALLILTPDISMLGYLVNMKTGTITYNLFHHKGVALIVSAAGYYMTNDIALSSGLILLAHSSLDRALGYGLKYPDSFQHTHLGMIGKNKNA